MNESIRLGSVRGIRIGVHWSVLFIAWLLAWGLATQILPAAAPGADPALYWLAGAGVAILFFASLLAHELAHAFFAQRAGMKVDGITLWLLGGVAKLEGEVPSPGHDLRIAASGPAVSALMGLAFGAVSIGLDGAGAPVLLTEAAGWLARVNLILAAFNLLPGAPLDGGRIVRALAWKAGRDRLRASLLATRLGRLLGFVLITIGVLEFIVGAGLGGLWTIVIGLFLTGAAGAESRQEIARTALEGVRVREVMTADPVRVPGGISVDVFLAGVLTDQQQAALVVEAGGEIAGVAGLREAGALSGSERRDQRVRDITLPRTLLPVVGPDEHLLEAMARAQADYDAATANAAWGGAGRPDGPGYVLVAGDDGVILGLVSPSDVARTLEERAKASGGLAGARPDER